MSPMQQMLLGAGGGSDPVYLDDIFSTYLYKGTGGNQTHNNGLDLSTEGGMVWVKGRSDAYAGIVTDTVRGTTKQIQTNTNVGELTSSARVTAFNTNGFTTSYEELVGSNNKTYASWSFRKAKNFFDIQSWNGNLTSGRQISHDLGCIPGLVVVKRNNGPGNWAVYHKSLEPEYSLRLNNTNAVLQNNAYWNNTRPTASTLYLGDNSDVNGGSGDSYVAYIFGGGESTAAEARSVDFNGSSDFLYSSSSSDFTMGTGDFTVECWARLDSLSEQGIFQISSGSEGWNNTIAGTIGVSAAAHQSPPFWEIYHGGGDAFGGTKGGALPSITAGVWYHVAYVRSSGVTKLYVNGRERLSISDTHNYTGNRIAIGRARQNEFNGCISNLRVVKGTAVYTSSFKPPTEPLANITNTKLLCCNNSSTTGSTVAPGTITAYSNPNASTDSPFDDPGNFSFGENKDENVIKCGKYFGNNTTNGQTEIYLGWEPSWVMIKEYKNAGKDWVMFDNIRGIYPDNTMEEKILRANEPAAEDVGKFIKVTATGFKIPTNHNSVNGAYDNSYIYVAVRMSDGLVGKIPTAGTSSFAVDYGNNSSTIPSLDSNFPVDLALHTEFAGGSAKRLGTRLLGTYYVRTDSDAQRANASQNVWDSSSGCLKSRSSDWIAWMWKRNAGFDIRSFYHQVNQGDHVIRHHLGRTPEMIWLKRITETAGWTCYHKGLNNGTNPYNNYIQLDTNGAEQTQTGIWGTSTTKPNENYVTLPNNTFGTASYIMYLFASVDKISSVGWYNGTGSQQTINTGFVPRFILIKKASTGSWTVHDSLRGITSGNDPYIPLESATGNVTGYNAVQTQTNAFSVDDWANNSGTRYLYYAHA